MPYELYVEVANFTVAAIFTKDDKSKLSKAMSAAAKAALVKSKLTVAKKTPQTRNFTLGGALTVKEKGAGARATVSIQLNRLPGDKLYGMASGGAETDDLNLIEDLAVAVVTKVVQEQITTALKKAAAEP
jgi:hypothetical protein